MRRGAGPRAQGGRPVLILSCEHGGNRIPPPYAAAFAGQRKLLQSHRGYDAGALEMARHLARAMDAPLYPATVSRLLVDLNRSLSHPALFSAFSKALPNPVRERIVREHYMPHRTTVEGALAKAMGRGRSVLHLCVHSFTPVLHGDVRRADVGLLYDPARPFEAAFARHWAAASAKISPALRVRMNYPYRGTSDGFTTALRRRWPASRYLGVELELNQRFVLAGGRGWGRFKETILAGLRGALNAFSPEIL